LRRHASPRAIGSGFLSFRSSTVVSSHGGRAQVRAKRVSLEDGKLSNESFEGELDGDPWNGRYSRQ